jgi:hypothetical protein
MLLSFHYLSERKPLVVKPRIETFLLECRQAWTASYTEARSFTVEFVHHSTQLSHTQIIYISAKHNPM